MKTGQLHELREHETVANSKKSTALVKNHLKIMLMKGTHQKLTEKNANSLEILN